MTPQGPRGGGEMGVERREGASERRREGEEEEEEQRADTDKAGHSRWRDSRGNWKS